MYCATKVGRCFSTLDRVDIPELLRKVTKDKFILKFIRSSGPGGQNVNKLNSKVELRLNLSTAVWLPLQVISKLQVQAKNQINKYGEIIVTSEKTRMQHRNVEDAIEKVKNLIYDAAYEPDVPTEETLKIVKERLTKANEKRLLNKKLKSAKKSDRKFIE